MRARMLIGLGAALVCGSAAIAHWAAPTDVPIDRVVANLTKVVQEHPEDAQAWYTLGRARSFAFVHGVESIGIHQWGNEETGVTTRLPSDGHEQYWIDVWRRAGKTVELTESRALEQLAGSVTALGRAIELDANRPEFHLTLGYTLEKGIDLASKCPMVPPSVTIRSDDDHGTMPETLLAGATATDPNTCAESRVELRARILEIGRLLAEHREDARESIRVIVNELLPVYWRERAIQESVIAFRGAYPEDAKRDEQPLIGLCGLVSHEAGESYLRMVNEAPSTVASSTAARREITEGLKRIKSLPRCAAITPIIIATTPGARLRSLIDARASIAFDLAGDGGSAAWDWVSPDAGILVWDPKGTGRITSGRQLFGGATWWIFFANGYAALGALDDNGDGWLRAHELEGIAMWFDADSNGVSAPSEVVPVAELGIVGIACRSTTVEDGCLAHPTGVEWRDGVRTPSFDWVANRRRD